MLPIVGEQSERDNFVGEGFSHWKKKEKLQTHVRRLNNAHNQVWGKCEALLSQNNKLQHFLTYF